jgi:hypothetical protein
MPGRALGENDHGTRLLACLPVPLRSIENCRCYVKLKEVWV